MNGRPQYPCKVCVRHRAELVRIDIDEDGNEIPVWRHVCYTESGPRVQTESELCFGCGLFVERSF